MVIVDMGSGETCDNEPRTITRMIHALREIDSGKHEVVIKWQLFENIPPLKPLTTYNFRLARQIASDYGYETTASAFDDASIDFLLSEGVPWIKIAARPHLYRYVGDYPDMRFVVSIPPVELSADIIAIINKPNVGHIFCVPEYPASCEQYERAFGFLMGQGISDHTPSFYLYKKYQPLTYEAHFKMPDSTGADSGPWARTPEQWREILGA